MGARRPCEKAPGKGEGEGVTERLLRASVPHHPKPNKEERILASEHHNVGQGNEVHYNAVAPPAVLPVIS